MVTDHIGENWMIVLVFRCRGLCHYILLPSLKHVAVLPFKKSAAHLLLFKADYCLVELDFHLGVGNILFPESRIDYLMESKRQASVSEGGPFGLLVFTTRLESLGVQIPVYIISHLVL